MIALGIALRSLIMLVRDSDDNVLQTTTKSLNLFQQHLTYFMCRVEKVYATKWWHNDCVAPCADRRPEDHSDFFLNVTR